MFAGGLVLCGVLTQMAAKAAVAYEGLRESLGPPPPAVRERLRALTWSLEGSPTDRAKLGELYAKDSCHYYGEYVDIPTIDGGTQKYQPTEEDLRYREDLQKILRHFSIQGAVMRRAQIIWPLAGLISLFAAATISVSGRRPNKSLEPTPKNGAAQRLDRTKMKKTSRRESRAR
jgi:hypothetical protein